MTSLARKKTESSCLQKFCSNDIPNKFSISSKSTQTENWRQELIEDKRSDLTCTRKYALTKGPKPRRDGSYRGPLAQPSPPSLLLACVFRSLKHPCFRIEIILNARALAPFVPIPHSPKKLYKATLKLLKAP